jgi:hypothetical protein
MGSMALARRAGKNPETAATKTKIATAPAQVHASAGAMSNNCEDTERLNV